MGRCQGDDGFSPPVFTGAGSSWAMWDEGDGSPHTRGHGVGGNDMWVQNGWVPAPRLHGGRLSTRGKGGWVRLHGGRISTRGHGEGASFDTLFG